MVDAKSVIKDLREKNKALKDKIEAIKNFLKETINEKVFSEWQVTEYAKEVLKILEAEG